jgi:hypothetical protein
MPNHDYAAAVEFFMEKPGDILRAWRYPEEHPHGCLFKVCFPGGHYAMPEGCGCLTMIRQGGFKAFNAIREPVDYVTEAILSDDVLPDGVHKICYLRGDALRTALERHAEWQFALETELLL